MIRHLTALCAAGALVAACTSPDSETPTPEPEPEHPVLAFLVESTGGGDRSKIIAEGRQQTVDAAVRMFLDEDRILVDRFPEDATRGTAAVVDVATGNEKDGGESFDPGGAIGLGRDVLLNVSVSGSGKQMFRQLDFDFATELEVRLPGNGNIGEPGRGTTASYNELAGGDGAIFLTRTEWKGVEATSDSVTRVDGKGQRTTILKNKHVSNLTLASDGRSLVAALGADPRYYEGSPATTDIVELDPGTGEIVRSLGVPPPCRKFEPVFDDRSCLVRLDKVGDVVAAAVYESGDDDHRADAYSTWRHEDGQWSEVKEQRDTMVYWQTPTSRLEQKFEHGETPEPGPIWWVTDDGREEVEDTGEIGTFDWIAPGSLIKP